MLQGQHKETCLSASNNLHCSGFKSLLRTTNADALSRCGMWQFSCMLRHVARSFFAWAETSMLDPCFHLCPNRCCGAHILSPSFSCDGDPSHSTFSSSTEKLSAKHQLPHFFPLHSWHLHCSYCQCLFISTMAAASGFSMSYDVSCIVECRNFLCAVPSPAKVMQQRVPQLFFLLLRWYDSSRSVCCATALICVVTPVEVLYVIAQGGLP